MHAQNPKRCTFTSSSHTRIRTLSPAHTHTHTYIYKYLSLTHRSKGPYPPQPLGFSFVLVGYCDNDSCHVGENKCHGRACGRRLHEKLDSHCFILSEQQSTY
ncbi:hypothetical protein M440DRAFT_180065 [Trichoderma longibrachiatum ATCC 18648]|uniref:Uncharacterized protein n=1 Tax=Trichoderma longibrachiatum ATCC 18648 TaxID=983965 RepID=A0A2T4CEY1_TRILO|nr:hypothetical protein M440DRAFT_180065 [Trichoderma longibrachiatum ATCC 18648]